MSHASDQLWRVLEAGPFHAEDFYRVKAKGREQTKWFNASPAQLAAIARVMEDPAEHGDGRTIATTGLAPGAFKRWTITLHPDQPNEEAIDVLAPNSYEADCFMERLINISGADAYGSVIE